MYTLIKPDRNQRLNGAYYHTYEADILSGRNLEVYINTFDFSAVILRRFLISYL